MSFVNKDTRCTHSAPHTHARTKNLSVPAFEFCETSYDLADSSYYRLIESC